jgi:hypothetical protein
VAVLQRRHGSSSRRSVGEVSPQRFCTAVVEQEGGEECSRTPLKAFARSVLMMTVLVKLLLEKYCCLLSAMFLSVPGLVDAFDGVIEEYLLDVARQ